MSLKDFITRNPLTGALLFQGSLIPVAILLALLFGLEPWRELQVSGASILTAVFATVPPLFFAWLLSRQSFAWAAEIGEKVHEILELLFRNSGQGAVMIVSLLAGFGEELLFRGVIQAGLEPMTGAASALLLASLLFGLVHAITPAYFMLATVMGLYLGLLYQITGSLLIVSLVHALYDWAAITWYLRRYPP